MFTVIFEDIRFYFICILTLLVLSVIVILYLPPDKNVPIVLIIGFTSLILSEYKSAANVRAALKVANALKAEHIEEIMKKAEETYMIVKEIKKFGVKSDEL